MTNPLKYILGSYFPRHISSDQAKDTGMAIVLVCLLVGVFGQNQTCITVAVVLLIIDMVWPTIYRPLAKVWLGLSQILGTIMSKILLSIIYFGLVTPVGVIRKIIGADSLQLKKWKKDNSSVFRVRDHTYQSKDLEQPY